MIPDEKPSAGIGHNQPPSPIDVLKAAQSDGLEPFAKRRDEIAAAATKKDVRDRISAGEAGDIIKIARAVWDRIEAERKERTAPYDAAVRSAIALTDEFWKPVADAIADLRGRLKAWSDAEDERIKAQQREQEEAERAMRAQAAPAPAAPPPSRPSPPKRTKIRGDLGATVTTVDRKVFTVVDVRAVPDWVLNTPSVHDAIIAVVRGPMSKGAEIPGIATSTEATNQVR